MWISRFILIFEDPGRIDLHTLTLKKHIIFLIRCIVAALLTTLYLERAGFATE